MVIVYTQFNFKLYILNKLDSSSAVKAYKSTSCKHILSPKSEEHNKMRVQNEETALECNLEKNWVQ